MQHDRSLPDAIAAIDWGQIAVCGGVADGIPRLLMGAMGSTEETELADHWGELYQLTCHQDTTVYEATPAVVPLAGRIAASRRSTTLQRLFAVEYLSSVAMADEFVLPDGTTHRARWWRRTAAPVPQRDLSVDCRIAVGGCVNSVIELLDGLSLRDRARYLALAASSYEYVDEKLYDRVLAVPGSIPDAIVAAADVLSKLFEGTMIALPWLETRASTDGAVSRDLTELLADGCSPDIVELARCVSHGLAKSVSDA